MQVETIEEGFTPLDYIMADIATQYGDVAKSDWDVRIDWTLKHIDVLEKLTEKADDPIIYATAVRALRDVQQGLPTGYMVAFDASASGTQLLSAMTGDENGMKITNLITEHMSDPYTVLYECLQQAVAVKRIQWEANVTRTIYKQVVMTRNYGSDTEPAKRLPETIVPVFYESMATELPKVTEFNDFLIAYQSMALEDEFNWVLPDNFHVNTKVMNTEYKQVHCLGQDWAVGIRTQGKNAYSKALNANMVHSVEAFLARELIRRANTPMSIQRRVVAAMNGSKVTLTPHDTYMAHKLAGLYRKSGFLSARILPHLSSKTIDLIEPEKLVELLNCCSEECFQIKSVHDSYACHPNYASELLWSYRELMAELSDSDMLIFLMNQILHPTIAKQFNAKPGKYGDQIRKSEYILTP